MMSTVAQRLSAELAVSKKFLTTTLGTFDEDDSGFAPQPEMFTVAAHVAHIAGTVDWFFDGAFGEGWDMDFDRHIEESKEITSLAAAVEWLDRAYGRAIEEIGGMSDEALMAPIEDEQIMAGQPKAAIVSGIADHTAHHRGALTVYARLIGKEPIMPYA